MNLIVDIVLVATLVLFLGFCLIGLAGIIWLVRDVNRITKEKE